MKKSQEKTEKLGKVQLLNIKGHIREMGKNKIISIFRNREKEGEEQKSDNFNKNLKQLVSETADEEEKCLEDNLKLKDITAPDGMYEKILIGLHNNGQLREEDLLMLDKIKDIGEENLKNDVVCELTEEDREALLLGRRLKETGASSDEVLGVLENNKVRASKKYTKTYKWFGRFIKSIGVAAVVLVCVFGVTLSTEAGREYLKTLFSDVAENGIYIKNWEMTVAVGDEGEAYKEITNRLGIYPLNLYYTSTGLEFEYYNVWEGLESAVLRYSRDGGRYLDVYIGIADELATDTVLIDGKKVANIILDFADINVDIYELDATEETKAATLTALFWYDGNSYIISSNIEKEELLTIFEQ
jgi:hypothetical protein